MSKKHYYKCIIGLLKLNAMQCYYFKSKNDFLKACIAYNLDISDLTFYFYRKGVLGSTKEGLLSENVKKISLFQNNPNTEMPSLYLKLCGLPIRCIPQIDSLNTINHIRIVLGAKPFKVLPEVLFKIKVNNNASPRYITEITDWIKKIPILCEYADIIHVLHNNDDWDIIKHVTSEKTLESNNLDYMNLEKNILNNLNPEHICGYCHENLGDMMLKYINRNWNPNLVVWNDVLENIKTESDTENEDEEEESLWDTLEKMKYKKESENKNEKKEVEYVSLNNSEKMKYNLEEAKKVMETNGAETSFEVTNGAETSFELTNGAETSFKVTTGDKETVLGLTEQEIEDIFEKTKELNERVKQVMEITQRETKKKPKREVVVIFGKKNN
jgi:hypothetical protein